RFNETTVTSLPAKWTIFKEMP
ncbi:hypothetical protein AVEN_1775-1, partial [Araneus ventricosus]